MIKKKKVQTSKSSAKRPRKRRAKHPRNSHEKTFSDLGASLQEVRVHFGLTQKRMAELCGLQVSTISKIERGDFGVKLGTLSSYLNLLNLRLELRENEGIE